MKTHHLVLACLILIGLLCFFGYFAEVIARLLFAIWMAVSFVSILALLVGICWIVYMAIKAIRNG